MFNRKLWIFIVLAALSAVAMRMGWVPGLSKTAQAIDNTADAATGNQAVREQQNLKSQLDSIQKQRAQQFDGLQQR